MPLFALLFCLLALAGFHAPASAEPGSEKQRLEQYISTMLDGLWRLDPDAALAAGYYRYADRLSVPDAATRDATRAFLRQQLAALAGFDEKALAPAQRLDLIVMRRRFEADLWELDTFRSWQWQPSSYNVAPGFALQLDTGYAPLDTRLRHIAARLAAVPAYYAAAQANIAEPTLEHTVLAIEQNQGGLAVFGEDLVQQLARSGLADDEKQLFRTRLTAARAAIQGYLHFLGELQARLEARGARSFRIGPALYAQKFGHDIQSGYTAEQLHAKAKAEKAKLHDGMEALARTLWPKYRGNAPVPADRLELIGQVIAELGRNHVKPEAFVDTIRRQIPELARFVSEHDLVDQDASRPLVVREMPEYMRGTAGANLQAPGPYDAGANTYYNVTPLTGYASERAESFLREYNHWMLQLLSIHEAIPGHYTQLLHANKSNSLVKVLFGNGAMIEGWAVYGEKMMLDAGYGGGAPEMWLIWMKWNLRAVCNTLLDYEVHTGTMNEAQALALLTTEAFQSQAEAVDKWRRVRLTQVQLTSYFAGYAEITAWRDESKARLGKAFKLKDFNNRLLSYGSVPVRDIRQLMSEAP